MMLGSIDWWLLLVIQLVRMYIQCCK